MDTVMARAVLELDRTLDALNWVSLPVYDMDGGLFDPYTPALKDVAGKHGMDANELDWAYTEFCEQLSEGVMA